MYIEGIDPVMFTLGPLAVRWYGFMMALSFALGSYLIIKNGSKKGMDPDALLVLCALAAVGAILGARALYVLTNLPNFAANPLEAVRIDRGGLSFHGGLLGGMLGAWYAARRSWIPYAKVSDLAVPGICIGYALVRVANIFNQEILGRPAAALFFERHPAQVYGSLIGLVSLLIHMKLARKGPRRPGQLFWLFVVYYSLLRAVIEETFRDNPLYLWSYVNETWGIGFFTMTHLATPLILLLAFWMLRRKGMRTYAA
jgi:phosphatidylglycerol---prolipoprotein diacylglyceryl transferase